MKLHHSPRSVFTHIEPLEARIAPARVIVTGVPGSSPNETDYNEAPFVNIKTAIGDPIADAVRSATPDDVNTYYLKLSAGDKLQIFTGTFDNALVMKSGNAIAFFVDADGDNEVDSGELVSLSVGKNVSLSLSSGIAGDIVANLNEHGTKSTNDDTIEMSGLVSGSQGIKSLSIGSGNVSGKIMAGGSISNVTMPTGLVGGIFSGSAANGQSFDFFPGVAGGEGTIAHTPEAGVKGGSITNVLVGGLGFNAGEGRIEAGAGGAGAAGGAIQSVRILTDTDGFTIKAGDGGHATGSLKGGAGGSVSSLFVPSVADSTFNDLVHISAGHGGGSDAGSGGIGGSVSSVFIGYKVGGKRLEPSANLPVDNIVIEAGDGGSGKIGGKGGSVLKSDLLTGAPDLENADEILIHAGNGGAALDLPGAKAGAGGSISSLSARDVVFGQLQSIALQAGDGGTAAGGAIGAAGGSIADIHLLATGVKTLAGNGSDGHTGGAGGGLSKIVVELGRGVVAHSGVFNAGFGGAGAAGNGGAGGSINGLTISDGDFSTLEINSGKSGDGGNSVNGKGGNGGALTNLLMTDSDFASGSYRGTMLMRSGNGGNGAKGGGNGGILKSVRFSGEDLNADIQTGNGGNVLDGGTGKGGSGGSIIGGQIVSDGAILAENPDDPDIPVSATLHTGVGGAGKGANGSGGAGGSYSTVNIGVPGDLFVGAGAGGASESGAAGNGGTILNVGARSDLGSGSLIAGDAGATGVKPGAGGSILGSNQTKITGLYAAQKVTIHAGNGTAGGAGGSIRFVGYGSSAEELTPGPLGDILVQAGNGSAGGNVAGAGGSIISVNGSVTSASNTTTLILAGAGAGNATKASAGGSIVDMSIQRGGAAPSTEEGVVLPELRILAGDAGNSTGAAVGAKGGDVRDVRIFDISQADDRLTPQDETTDTVIRSIAAGRGGDAGGKGGQGGTIDSVRAFNHDIGVRSGLDYGYDKMGGLFAGAGGDGSTKGLAGNVTNINASAIAAIVAGRGPTPELVEKVSGIYLFSERGTALKAVDLLKVEPENGQPSDLMVDEPSNPEGGPANDPKYYAYRLEAYNTNNLVGAVKDPTRVDGNKFAFTDTNGNNEYDIADIPIDGLIAAKVFDQSKANFTPEARLIGGVFFDYDNRNDTQPTPVTQNV